MKRVSIALFLFFLLAIPQLLHAQDTTTDTTVSSDGSTDTTTDSTTDVTSPVDFIRDARDAARATLDEARIQRSETLEDLRATRAAAREAAQAAREEAQAKRAELRDEKKQEILENLAARKDAILDKWIEHWGRIVDRLNAILEKINSRAARLEEQGADISGVQAAVTAAQDAILDAEALLDELAGKDYVLDFTDESSVGTDIRGIISQFKEDLASVRVAVKAAREATHDAFEALRLAHASITANNAGEESTSASPSATPEAEDLDE